MESKYDCSISFCISRNGVFYDFSNGFFFQKKNRYKKLTELEFLNPIVGCCHGTVSG